MRKKDIIFIYTLIIMELLILINSKIIIGNVIFCSILYITKIFPSMFPSMVISNMLINTNIKKIIPKHIKKIFYKVFNLSDDLTVLYILSMFCGSPTNAILVNDYVNKGIIKEDNIELILGITSFINPLFITGGIGIGVFNNIKIGFILLIMQYVSSLIKLFINKRKIINQKSDYRMREDSAIINIKLSINKSINACLSIFGIVIMFNILICLINNIFHINDNLMIIINSLVEITSGIVKLNNLNINYILKILLAYLFINFQGLCIQMQSISMIENK